MWDREVEKKSLQIFTELFQCLIIQMHTYFLSFTLLKFCSVAVIAGLQEELIVEKCIADIYQELSDSCVFVMKSTENNKVKRRNVVILEKKMCSILSHQKLQV